LAKLTLQIISLHDAGESFLAPKRRASAPKRATMMADGLLKHFISAIILGSMVAA
jgi:hypothetical protein